MKQAALTRDDALEIAQLKQVARSTIAAGRWLGGLAAALIAALLVGAITWTAAEVRALRIEVTQLRTEIDLVKPADVLAELRLLRGELAAANERLDEAIGTDTP